MKTSSKLLGTILLASTILLGCSFDDSCSDNSSDAKVAASQEVMLQQAVSQVGMPNITNFTELKLVKYLYELRDQKINTYAYLRDYNGHMWHICDSIGYGIPYATQFSNPEKHVYTTNYSYNIPQAEPNGLFMPNSAEGTWVICVDPSKPGGISPVYEEDRVTVSPFKLNSVGELAAK